MSRIPAIPKETATGHVREVLEGVGRKFGMVPNMMRAMANSPVALDSYLQFGEKLGHGTLPAKVREQIALAVAEANWCEYCLAAHSAIGKMLGLTSDQIRDSRLASAVDPQVDALLRFVRRIVETHGRVSEDDVQAVRKAGYGDEAIAEIVANVAINIFTNYFNLVADTDVDFPGAPALATSASTSA